MHDQLNKLDSVWAYDVSNRGGASARLVALGQDRFATDEDNEPTGLHFSDGDSSILGLIGRNAPNPRIGRLFFTQQHGENNLYRVVVQPSSESIGQ